MGPYFYLEFQNDVDTFTVKKSGVRGESLEPPEEEVVTDNDPKQRQRKIKKEEYKKQQEAASIQRQKDAGMHRRCVVPTLVFECCGVQSLNIIVLPKI